GCEPRRGAACRIFGSALLGGGGNPAHGRELHSDPRLFCQQMENLAHVLAVFRGKLLVAQQIEDLTEHRLSRKNLGEIPRQEACCRKEHVSLALTQVHRIAQAIDRVPGWHARAALETADVAVIELS